jgi:hypothetical protein
MSAKEFQRKERDSLFMLAAMRLAEGEESYRIRIRNLSTGGLMAEASLAVETGQQVMIDIRNIGWVLGHVVWSVDNRFGVAFASQIDPKAARMLPAPSETSQIITWKPLLNGVDAPRHAPKAIRRV